MNQLENINDYLLGQSALIGFGELFVKLALATTLSLIVSYGYVKYSSQISPSSKFYSYISMLAILVTIIIAVVKGSLALSLGLVGALSIVRFRTAVKEPNELLAFFAAIAIGISIGADQYKVAILASFFIFVFYLIMNFVKRKKIITEFTIISIRFPTSISIGELIDSLKNVIEKSFIVKSVMVGEGVSEVILEVTDYSVNEINNLQILLANKYTNSEFRILPKLI